MIRFRKRFCPAGFCNLRFNSHNQFFKLVFLSVKNFKSLKCFAGALCRVIIRSDRNATDSSLFLGVVLCSFITRTRGDCIRLQTEIK